MRAQRKANKQAERYENLRLRIQCTTTAIWRTQLQPIRPQRVNIAQRRKRVGWTKAYQDIATLLTCNGASGSDIVVTGPLPGRGNLVTICASRDSDARRDAVGPDICRYTIQPSSKALRELALDNKSVLSPCSRCSGTNQRSNDRQARAGSLFTHASDVLKALLSASQPPGPDDTEDHTLLCVFAHRRCWPFVYRRLRAARYLLDLPDTVNLASALSSWRFDHEGLLPIDGEWHLVSNDSRLRQALAEADIPITETVRGLGALLDARTVRLWMDLLSGTIQDMFATGNEYNSRQVDSEEGLLSSLLRRLVESMRLLECLLNSHPIQRIFQFESLARHLQKWAREPTTRLSSVSSDYLTTLDGVHQVSALFRMY